MGQCARAGREGKEVIAVSFEPEAAEDLQAAYDWYEERRAGLGHRFLDAVENAVTRISAEPRAFPVRHRGLRRVLVERFPYALYYRVYPAQVAVVAVFHGRRSPRRLALR